MAGCIAGHGRRTIEIFEAAAGPRRRRDVRTRRRRPSRSWSSRPKSFWSAA